RLPLLLTLRFLVLSSAAHPTLPPFPTRRSSDLMAVTAQATARPATIWDHRCAFRIVFLPIGPGTRIGTYCASRPIPNSLGLANRDRKSTRLNSSHGSISYAVFCLKKKNQRLTRT